MGIETTLVPLMAELARTPSLGRGLTNQAAKLAGFDGWPEFFAGAPRFRRTLTGGSPNHQAMVAACGLYHPATFDEAVASWRVCAETEPLLGFEREEPGSRIYGTWSLNARLLLLAHPDTPMDLKDYARDWLAMFWGLGALSAIPFGGGYRSLRCGSRSQGVFGPMKSDVALTIAMGKEPVFGKGDKFPPFWRKSPEVIAILALRGLIEDSSAAAEHLAYYPPNPFQTMLLMPAGWTSQATTWCMRTTAGLVVWLDEPERGEGNDDVPNKNTPGIAAMGYDENGIWSLPPPSRDHVRQKRVIEMVRTRYSPIFPSRPGWLDYHQGGAGRSMSISQDLPKGDMIYLVKHDPKGLERIL